MTAARVPITIYQGETWHDVLTLLDDALPQGAKWAGLWDAGEPYPAQSVVVHEGVAYVARRAVPANTEPPATHWAQFARAIDLTGAAAFMTVRDQIGGTALVAIAIGAGIEVDAANGTLAFTIDADATADLAIEYGVYDRGIVSAGGEVTPITYGPVALVKRVTEVAP